MPIDAKPKNNKAIPISPNESVGFRSTNEEPPGPIIQWKAIAITDKLTRATTPQQSFCLEAIPFLATRTKVATIKHKKMIRISWSGDIVSSVEFVFPEMLLKSSQLGYHEVLVIFL